MTLSTADPSPRATDSETDLFGHPRGLTFLFATEMWERFSYYGMRALLVLYMVKYLLLPEHAENVIGLGALRQLYESMFGPLGAQPFSSHIYGLYTGLVYLTPLFGGILADRVLGQHRTILLGAALMAIGHFMMAFEPLFLFALTVLILGNGAFKPNMSAQVGGLYAPGDRAPRPRLFDLLCRDQCRRVSRAAGLRNARRRVRLALRLHGRRRRDDDRACDLSLRIARAAAGRIAQGDGARACEKQPLDRSEWLGILALLALFVPTTLFWATYEQQGNTIALWADDYTDRTIDLLIWRGEIPVTWFQAFNPFMIFAFTPFIVALWAWQAKRRAEPSSVTKMSLGCFGVALANLIMVGAAWQAAGAPDASWLWLLGYFVVITIGELYLSPIGLSLVSKVAPARMVSMLMGVWLATSFAGNFIAGWLGSYWSGMDKPMFFLMIAGIALIAGLVILAFERPLRNVIRDRIATADHEFPFAAPPRAPSATSRPGCSISTTRSIRTISTSGSRWMSASATTSRAFSRSRMRKRSTCRRIITSATAPRCAA